MIRCRVSSLADLAPESERAWADLVERALEPTLFLDPTYLRVSARHMLDPNDLSLLILEDDDRLLGLMAFEVRRVWPQVPVRMVTTGHPFMRADAGKRQPLLDRDRAAETAVALVDGLKALDLPGLLEFDFMPLDGEQAEIFCERSAERGLRVVERWRDERAYAWLDGRNPGPEVTPETLFVPHHSSAVTRKGFRRDARHLASDIGHPLVFAEQEPSADVLEQFLALQASGWKGDPEKGGAAYLLHPHLAAWFRDLTSEFASEGRLMVFDLRAGDEILFMSIMLRTGNTLVSLTDAYEERFAARHPGSLGRVAELNTVRGLDGIAAFDPGFSSRYVTSARLYPDRRPHGGILLGDDRIATTAFLRSYDTGRRWVSARRARKAARAEEGAG